MCKFYDYEICYISNFHSCDSIINIQGKICLYTLLMCINFKSQNVSYPEYQTCIYGKQKHLISAHGNMTVLKNRLNII